MYSFNACLKLQIVGSEYREYLACQETYYAERENSGMYICPGFNFIPNGDFHRSRLGGSLVHKSENAYDDSLTLSVGKCVDISD
jgi:hypothetical protein